MDLAPKGTKRLTYSLPVDVDRTLSPDDAMYEGHAEHYFSTGESALRVILAAISLAQAPVPQRILDFGAGAGRVTRWLKAAFPDAQIHGCDVREGDMAFLRSTFGVKAWTVGFDFNDLTIADRYDLIWVGSIITHLPKPATRRLIRKLVCSLNPGGLLAVSFHGRYVIDRRESGTPEARYIHDKGWRKIKSRYRACGYGYADYPNQSGYGISVTSAPWMTKFGESLGCRLILLSERIWDNHHDVIVLQQPG